MSGSRRLPSSLRTAKPESCREFFFPVWLYVADQCSTMVFSPRMDPEDQLDPGVVTGDCTVGRPGCLTLPVCRGVYGLPFQAWPMFTLSPKSSYTNVMYLIETTIRCILSPGDSLISLSWVWEGTSNIIKENHFNPVFPPGRDPELSSLEMHDTRIRSPPPSFVVLYASRPSSPAETAGGLCGCSEHG